jgi:hypothetical protein
VTVCIAALCHGDSGNDPLAVIAADRMVTLGGFIEFEHAVPKMAHPSPFAVAMIAGDTLIGTRIAQEVASSLAGTSTPLLTIAQNLAEHYEATRQGIIEANVLAPRGLSFQTFYGSHASLNGQITMMLDQAMANLDVNVELVLAGVDAQGAHIYTIGNPGRPERQHDVIGYAATGSGAIHAMQSMIGFGHSSTAGLNETVFRIYASKRRAEVAPGVGAETDLAIISDGGLEWLDVDSIVQLSGMYDRFRDSSSTALRDELARLDLRVPKGTVGDSEGTGSGD